MKISTRGRYALRMMVELAKKQGDGYVSLTEIAESQNISKKYLEQIIPLLSHASFLTTTRGFRGGYRLSKSPSEYCVGDILRVTEGSISPVSCADVDNPCECEKCGVCKTYPLWRKLTQIITDYLDSVTLDDLVKGRIELDSVEDVRPEERRSEDGRQI
ncbi:MAG: Rrf2 family transcriptional regulator [Thermoguttaceae bacterium]|nr:Rrf2 family transcriptional regulator [Thermoguttaceae bacterium]